MWQAYGQQSYGTYGQPTDVSYTQAQTTATYGQTAYAGSYGQPPTGTFVSPALQPVFHSMGRGEFKLMKGREVNTRKQFSH